MASTSQPFYEYEKPFLSTAAWYISHGRSEAETLSILEQRFGVGRASQYQNAIAFARQAQVYDELLALQSPGNRLYNALNPGIPVGTVVGLRVMAVLRTPSGVREEVSVTVNVPSDWTINQILDSVDAYILAGNLGRRSGRHYEGEIQGYQLFGLTGIAFDNPALDLAGFIPE